MNSKGNANTACTRASGRTRAVRSADDLVIAGLVPLSTVDWPGKLVATVFLQGCPWSCVYCHNEALIDTRTPGSVTWEQVRQLLHRRHGLLDGVVFTGGEACRQSAALADAARWAHDAGFKVGLHTAGAFPAVVRRLLEDGLVDWVGLDIKALPQDYPTVVQRNGSGIRAWETLDIVVAAGVDHEVRLTTFPAFPRTEVQIAQQVAQRGGRVFALQQARPQGTPAVFAAELEAANVGGAWDHQFNRIVQQVRAEAEDCFQQLLVRAAD